MVRLHKTKHFSWINQKLALHFPMIAEFFPAVPPVMLIILSIGYVQFVKYAWPWVDQFLFDKSGTVSSGVLAFVLVIIPIQCTVSASIIMMLNEFLTLDQFETQWQRYKPAITGIVFFMIGCITVSLNTIVFNAMGAAFTGNLGAGLSLLSLFFVTLAALVCCWPGQSQAVSTLVNTHS